MEDTTVHWVRRGDIGTPISSRSTWMINIGTHKKPANDQEREILQESLASAIRRVFSRETLNSDLFYPAPRRGSSRLDHKAFYDPVFRNARSLPVTRKRVRFAIEGGGVGGRVDAHILLDVEHEAVNGIRLDREAVQVLLDEELEEENRNFQERGVMSGDTFLRWAAPKLYVSFRLIGAVEGRNTENYIKKEFTESEARAVTDLLPQVTVEAPFPDRSRILPSLLVS